MDHQSSTITDSNGIMLCFLYFSNLINVYLGMFLHLLKAKKKKGGLGVEQDKSKGVMQFTGHCCSKPAVSYNINKWVFG